MISQLWILLRIFSVFATDFLNTSNHLDSKVEFTRVGSIVNYDEYKQTPADLLYLRRLEILQLFQDDWLQGPRLEELRNYI